MPSQAAKLRAQKKKQAQKNKGKPTPKNGVSKSEANGNYSLLISNFFKYLILQAELN